MRFARLFTRSGLPEHIDAMRYRFAAGDISIGRSPYIDP